MAQEVVAERYTLIDTESANEVGYYESMPAALQDVLATAEMYGSDAPEVLTLALVREAAPTGAGGTGSRRIAAGSALLALARERLREHRYAHAPE